MKQNNQTLGMGAAFLANTIFGFSFMFSKMALSVANPLIILAMRFTVAFLVLNVLLLTGKFKVRFKNKPINRLLLMSVAQPFCYYILELYGLTRCSSALSGVIIALTPVMVLLLSNLFLHEKPTAIQWVCTAVSLIGVAAISFLKSDGAPNYLLGILLLFGAVLSAAAFNLLSRKESAAFSAFERTYFMFAVGSVGFNLIALGTLRQNFLPMFTAAVTAPIFWAAIFYLAVLSSVAAFLLYNYSTSQISAIRASSFSNIITVVSVLAGVLILAEPFTPLELVLCGVIVLGVFGVNRQKA